MTVNNLLLNGGFETGDFQSWEIMNSTITQFYSHTGNASAKLGGGTSPASISQTVPVAPGQNFQLLASLSSTRFLSNPRVTLVVDFLDENNAVITNGLFVEISQGDLPNAVSSNWTEIYHTTDIVPETATQAIVQISKQSGNFLSSSILVDDVALLDFDSNPDIPGPTGPEGTTGY
ncbi:NTTRR-F1 domain [Virgibacillus salexigens]|uniref:NTTRR-F1 domain n=1 Tax=Virgibacillus salexigens TaxID=61016 RepID=UPI0019098A52|nr:NTTRR-F1 domain [Virgibacillus salexigens]